MSEDLGLISAFDYPPLFYNQRSLSILYCTAEITGMVKGAPQFISSEEELSLSWWFASLCHAADFC